MTSGSQRLHIEYSERLLSEMRPGDAPTLYWSMADRPGIVLGFSQKPTVLNQEALTAEPMEVYQRRAGGAAVLVGPHLLALDVLLPAGHPLILPDVVESYRWLGEAWMEALRAFGISARTISPEEAHTQRALLKQPETREHELLMQRACYGTLSSYEVAVGRRKLVGLDMIRRRTGTLLQAGLILRWENDTLARLLGHTEEEREQLRAGLPERVIGIEHVAGRVIPSEEVIMAFEHVIFHQ